MAGPTNVPKHLQKFAEADPYGNGKRFPQGTFDVSIQLIKHDYQEVGNEPYYLAELRVDAVISGGDVDDKLREGIDGPFVGAIKEGDVGTFFQGFKYEASALAAIKAFLMASYSVALGALQGPRDVGNSELMDSYHESQPLADIKLRLQVTAKLKKDKSGYSPRFRWSPRPDDPLYAAAEAAGLAGDGEPSDP